MTEKQELEPNVSGTATEPSTDASLEDLGIKPGRPTNAQWAIVAVVAYYAFGVLVPLVPVPTRPVDPKPWILLQLVVTLGFMALQLWLPWAVLSARPSTKKTAIATLLCALGWAVIQFSLPSHARAIGHHGLIAVLPLVGLLETLALAYMGGLLSRIIREAKILLPVGIVAGLVDVFGAMMPTGYTSNMVNQHPEVVRAVSVPVPTVGSLHPISLVGPGDALFLGFFFATVLRFRMNYRASFWLMYALLTLSMLIVVFSPFSVNIGALMPMGIAMLVANWRYFKFSREEKFAMLYAGALVLAGAIAFFALTNRFMFHHHR